MLDELLHLGTKVRHRPVVSVIVPSYNRSAYIGDAIASVLSQSYKNFELIVVDDGSTDSTGEVVNAFGDERLIFLRQENRGRSAARNRAISIAQGKYIAFLDSDDLYLTDKLEKQISYMDSHPEVGMVYTSAHCIDDFGNVLSESLYRATLEGNIYREVAFFLPVTITLPTVMVRREVLESVGYFDEAMERFEDTDLWRRIAKRYQIGIIEEATCRLRTHADNTLISQDPRKIMSSIEYYVTKVFREDADVGVGLLRKGASRLFEYYGVAFLSVSGWRSYGVFLLTRSVAFDPMRARRFLLWGLYTLARSLKHKLRLRRR